MLFNPAKSMDFMPQLNLDGQEIDLVEEIKILGLVIRSDLKWASNTDSMVLKGFKRIWMLRRLKQLGANRDELLDVYIKQVRSVLELAVPVWHSCITMVERCDMERVRRAALHIILGDEYLSYKDALKLCQLESLEDRRVKLCSKFANKAVKSDKFKNWFKVNDKCNRTRQKQPQYCSVWARTTRYLKSPLSYLTSILNQAKRKK